jgi:type I restriction enzyme R subunit
MNLHASHSVHLERVVQDHLIDQLVNSGEYERRDPKTDYDRAVAMDKALVLRFVQSTQAEEWAKLAAHYTASAEETFFTQLAKLAKAL